MTIENIVTERLTLIPVTFEITTSLLEGKYDVIQKMGFLTDEMWPTSDTKDILPSIDSALEHSEPSGFEFWMVVKRDSNMIIGDVGFHGKPNAEGEVEVGFGFVEKERGKGFGFESLKGIMQWLETQDSVSVIKADCLISNQASIRLLEKAGMNEVYRNEEYIFWRRQLRCI
ncbi:MAG TPA: N-acetyltransferase [Clostridiales bacterium UBA8960]|nr:N-acetyltransferase [Clostridiales bacterium UBA8960]